MFWPVYQKHARYLQECVYTVGSVFIDLTCAKGLLPPFCESVACPRSACLFQVTSFSFCSFCCRAQVILLCWVVRAQVRQGMLCVQWGKGQELGPEHGSREDHGEVSHRSQGQVSSGK